ncbi:MAG: sensor histidine kinase [Oligoflexus sp.]
MTLDCFSSNAWVSFLGDFAAASNMSIIFVALPSKNIAGPFGQSPLNSILQSAKLWQDNAPGSKILEHIVQDAYQKIDTVYCRMVWRKLAVCCIKIQHQGQDIGLAVIGWVPATFIDPLGSEHLASILQQSSFDVWKTLRGTQPVSELRLLNSGKLFQTAGHALIQQMYLERERWQETRLLSIIYDCVTKINEARRETEIVRHIAEAAQKIVGSIAAEIQFHADDSHSPTANFYYNCETCSSTTSALLERYATISIPLKDKSHRHQGRLNLYFSSEMNVPDVNKKIDLLSLNLATALQKLNISRNLEEKTIALNKANKKLRNAAKLKDEFLANISHDLKNPLNAVVGWSDLALMLDGEERDQAIKNIQSAAQDQVMLIEQLMDISKLSSGKLEIHCEQLDLLQVIEDAVSTFVSQAAYKKVQILREYDSKPIFIFLDYMRMKRVFWNLISNALKFTPEGGCITIKIQQLANQATVSVRDTGRGIAPDFLPHIFDRFSQQENIFTEKRLDGLGIGLSICKSIVTLHKGEIRVTSDGLDKGSEFQVVLMTSPHFSNHPLSLMSH